MSSFRSGKLIRQYRFLDSDAAPQVDGAPTQTVAGLALDEAGVAALWENEPAGNPVEDARAEADRLLKKARQEAEMLAAKAREDARREGFEAGRQEGLALAERETRDEIANLQEILQGTVAQRAQLLSAAEDGLVELALAIARKVIGDAASRDVGVVVDMARQAIEVLGRPGSVRVHLNPQDAERLESYWQFNAGRPEWEIVQDERVSRGGCIVTSGAGEVDARPETQLSLIQRSFTQAKEER